eukprot:s486_g14.t1
MACMYLSNLLHISMCLKEDQTGGEAPKAAAWEPAGDTGVPEILLTLRVHDYTVVTPIARSGDPSPPGGPVKGPRGPKGAMTGLRLNGGYDFSRSCAAQQSHTSAGTALQNALLHGSSARPCHDVSTAKEDGNRVVTWGSCNSGGDCSSVQDQLKNVQQIQTAVGGAFAAILADGSIVAWGGQENGGDCSAVQDQLKNVRHIQTTGESFAAILADGSVVTWGDPESGGTCTAVQHQLRNVKQIQATAGAFAAILADGSVVAWGDPDCGGECSAAQDQLRNVQAIQATATAFAAILADGSVVAWGDPHEGGDCSSVQGQLRNVQQIQATYCGAFAAILADGSVVTWGNPHEGGDCSSVQGQLRNVQQSQATSQAFAAILADGSVIAWGLHGGDCSAVQDQLRNVRHIQATGTAFAAILADGSVVAWGWQGGDCSAVQDQLRNVQQIHATWHAFAAILADGSVVAWGDPRYGGDCSAVQEQLRNVQAIQATATAFAAILADGSVVAWGDPVQGGDCSAVQHQAAYHTTGLDSGPRPEEVKTQRLPTPPRPAPPAERPTAARPRRPATAHPRLQENRAQTDPGVAPAAGMRTPRAVRAWQSADAALAAEIHRRPVGGGADVAMAEDPGWTPHRQFAPEELRYNPITHQVDVFVNVDGDIQKCEPSAEEYRQMLVRLENALPKKGRRKGLSEFVDLCCAGRARPNPHIKAAYAQNRRVFEKQRGPCTNMYEDFLVTTFVWRLPRAIPGGHVSSSLMLGSPTPEVRFQDRGPPRPRRWCHPHRCPGVATAFGGLRRPGHPQGLRRRFTRLPPGWRSGPTMADDGVDVREKDGSVVNKLLRWMLETTLGAAGSLILSLECIEIEAGA